MKKVNSPSVDKLRKSIKGRQTYISSFIKITKDKTITAESSKETVTNKRKVLEDTDCSQSKIAKYDEPSVQIGETYPLALRDKSNLIKSDYEEELSSEDDVSIINNSIENVDVNKHKKILCKKDNSSSQKAFDSKENVSEDTKCSQSKSLKFVKNIQNEEIHPTMNTDKLNLIRCTKALLSKTENNICSLYNSKNNIHVQKCESKDETAKTISFKCLSPKSNLKDSKSDNIKVYEESTIPIIEMDDFDEEWSLDSSVKTNSELPSSSQKIGTSTQTYEETDSLEICKYDFEDDWCTDIDFNVFQRCKVLNVKRERYKLLLTVEQENLAAQSTVTCSGGWLSSIVNEGDQVIIKAKKKDTQWVVDNEDGMLVIHPDILLSGTTICGATFCRRKSILQEKFRKMESLPYYEEGNSPLVIGILVHKLFQNTISKRIFDISKIEELVNEMLKSTDTIELLYAGNITMESCKEEILTYVPRIHEFVLHYLENKNQSSIQKESENFRGRITEIQDIEENIWLPQLGIKGRIDLSIEVKIHSKKKIMPLEVKTGRPSFSNDHKAQVILYVMMMALTGRSVDTGLLLYLKNNNIQEIICERRDAKDLIILRNILADHLIHSYCSSELKLLKLPDPIDHPFCARCPYKNLCCVYLTKDTEIKLSESHPLKQEIKEVLEKFNPSHIDYVLRWISLMEMEENFLCDENTQKYLWTLSPEKREAKKICICNLKVIGNVTMHNSRYMHDFVRAFSGNTMPYTEFKDNEYILVSTNERINITAGIIFKRNEDRISILLDKNLTKFYKNEIFHIDKYNSSNFISSNLANIGGLLDDNQICNRLRNIIIDRQPATFRTSSILARLHNVESIQELNDVQTKAVEKALCADDYLLIKGMPGTGKTQTLVSLIILLHHAGYSVLITAHTNNAVDNILLKLLDKGIDFLRLGSSAHPTLKTKTDVYATSRCTTPDELDAVYSSKGIVGVTCYGSYHIVLGRRTFDYCLIDESTQALQPTVLRPLYSAKKFILVGDPDQLPPIIRNTLAKKLGADESLFARLDNQNNTINLTKQYRMNERIMHVANKLTYNDMLEAGNKVVANATFVSDASILTKESKWIQKILSSSMIDSVIVINTGCTCNLEKPNTINDKYSRSNQVNSNIWEAAIVFKLVQTLLKVGAKPENIGIITPYRAHVNLLCAIITDSIEINTVDQYQGRDKEIIIYSCAKSLIKSENINEDLEILGDHRRLTVAITRAKQKLIVIADKSTISQYKAFKKLFNLVGDKSTIDLKENCEDFSWGNIVSDL